MNGKIHSSEKGESHLCDPGVSRLLGAWLHMGRRGRLPSPSQVEMGRIPADLRAKSFMCRFDGNKPTLEFVGEDVADFLRRTRSAGRDITAEMLKDYADVIVKRQPICTFVSGEGEAEADYERLLLPLSSDGAEIDGLLGGLFVETD